jgi:ankyrin repeat domain-containing protein 50
MLNILCCATRPLSGAELLDALAIKFDPNSSSDCLYRYDTRRRCADISVFEEICPGFLELHTDYDTREVTIRIAHFSIQEFLESERILCYNNIEIFHVPRHRGHTQMAGICLASLLHPQQKNCPPLSDGIEENAFLQYAACYWHEHFAQCSSKASIGRQALSLFQAKSPQFQRWIRVFGDDGDKCRSACKNSVPLYYAAKLGLVIIVRLLLASHKVRYGSAPAPGNDQKMDDSNTVALRNPGVSKSLPKDLYINFEAGFYGTALQVASYEGHTSIVKLLLDRGADSNVQNKYCETPLKVASIRGYESIVKLLLDNGADVNTNVDGIFNTALQAASFSGRERVVQLLLA